jgi:single-strand DNA-binding protein
MVNQVILVGRIVKDPEVKTTSEGKKLSNIVLAVNRSYKSSESGKYEADFIYCTLWENLAVATANYCKKGSIIGLKGRISTKSIELENNKKFSVLDLVAENVTFISSSSNKENDSNVEANSF